MRNIWKYFFLAGFAIVGAFCFAILYYYDPDKYGFYPGCMFHALTGLNCPGCGTLRALHQLSHGNPGAALRLNPLMVIALPFFSYYLLSELLNQIYGKRLPSVFKSPVWGWVLVGIIIAYWVLRNLPVCPFTLFSP